VKATVIKSTGSNITVRDEVGEVYLCKVRGNFRIKDIDATNPVAVGDVVDVELRDHTHFITALHERRNYIIRKSVKLSKQVQILAANIDTAYVIATLVLPKTSTGFIDRFLATAEAYNINAGIIINKIDLLEKDLLDEAEELMKLYSALGYKVFLVSAFNANDMSLLSAEISGKVNLFSGHSGVGKSTLINALIPRLDLKTGQISRQHLTGKHTTTFAEMHALPSGGYIIDSPGIREFGIFDFDKYNVSHYFPEMFKLLPQCRYNNCTHTNENGCAVIKAVERGDIAESRYNNYVSILNNEDFYK
jgi:ribosome biogenesis GTPase